MRKTFSIHTGDEPLWGRTARDPFGIPPAERTKLVFRQHGALARHLLRGLIDRGFDVANLGKFEPRDHPGRGVSHMVSNLVQDPPPTDGRARLDSPASARNAQASARSWAYRSARS